MRIKSNLAIEDNDPRYSYTTPASGCRFSPGLEIVDKSLSDYLKETAIGLLREQALLSLEEVFKECSKGNWDNYGAKPISYKAYAEAKRLIEWLPSSFPMPEIIPEPTGEIALEWRKDRQFVFIISVGGNNIITYAGMFGKDNKIHGTEFFVDASPTVIIRCIQRLYKDL